MNRRNFMKTGAGLAALSLMGGIAMAKQKSGLWVPPEEGPHELTLMQWPVNRQVYNDQYFLKMVQQTIAEIANTIAEFEPVVMLAAANHHKKLRHLLSADINLWDIPTDDLWCRDSGPLFATDKNKNLVVSHIQFNGWGDKQIHDNDGAIARKVAERLNIPIIASELTGEAGGVEHDGHGLLMAHESSWLINNRNPDLIRAEIERKLLDAYGAKRIFWAPGVKDQDITDYHIDSLARFTGPGRVIINLPDDPDMSDPFHRAALETHDLLKSEGLDLEIISEPHKRRIKNHDFVASYVNFYVCNNAVIAAQFGDRDTDEIAVQALKKHYPGREIVSLNVDALGEIGGGIHCATQQMPSL